MPSFLRGNPGALRAGDRAAPRNQRQLNWNRNAINAVIPGLDDTTLVAAMSAIGGMTWELTPQGADFWNTVYEEMSYLRLANQERVTAAARQAERDRVQAAHQTDPNVGIVAGETVGAGTVPVPEAVPVAEEVFNWDWETHPRDPNLQTIPGTDRVVVNRHTLAEWTRADIDRILNAGARARQRMDEQAAPPPPEAPTVDTQAAQPINPNPRRR